MAQIAVIGAGMAGIGAALALQARGRDVTVIDRLWPGEGTSHGNAGLIQAEAAEP
ncbi:FAD-dependent oxidoreductase [Mangrovicoccus ximenensis]|uniref:FAD-dependent oxidoreductase n=1 Tax=Mangrovicoccus ximenensis TaxID=1911570 RepID=UPI000D37EC5C